MTEEMRKAYEAEMAKPWTSMRELSARLFTAGAAWGAAARQRHDEQVCDRVGAGYQALGHQRGVDACIDCKEEIHASQQMPEVKA